MFQNSYSANRGKRDISEEEEFEDDEITEDELDELMGRYFNPNGFFFQPGKRSNPNSKSQRGRTMSFFSFFTTKGKRIEIGHKFHLTLKKKKKNFFFRYDFHAQKIQP